MTIETIFNTACYTLADALIWFVLGAVFGLKVLKKEGKG